MKKITLLFVLLFSICSYSQNFKPLKIELKGRIELDGHVHYTKSSGTKFYFEADLLGMKITDSKGLEYENRKCSVTKCSTIHLVKKERFTTPLYNNPNLLTTPN